MDRLSALPDELIHRILSSVESNVAAQTCVLSKRWVNLWSTLPFLIFDPCHFDKYAFYYRKFVRGFISHRNEKSDTSSINIDFRGFDPVENKPFFEYAISHNVKKFHIRRANFHCDLSFPMLVDLSISNSQVPLGNWSLPCLTSLRLESVSFLCSKKLLSFPHLKTLHLAHSEVPFMDWTCVSLINLSIEHVKFRGDRRPLSFPVLETLRLTYCQVYLKDWSLPSVIHMHLDHVTCVGNNRLLSFGVLETLHISHCEVPFWRWSFPVLSSLHLERVRASGDGRLFNFEGFNQLKNLTLVGYPEASDIDVSVITYTVTSLTVSQCICAEPPTCEFVIVAPNLSFFKFQGNCVPITFSAENCFSRLMEVDFDLDIGKYDWKEYTPEERNELIQKLNNIFHAFRETKFLKLSFMTIKVLSRISNFSEYQPFPFGNLESLTVLGSAPQSERLMEIPAHVLRYLLSSSRGARIFIKDYYRKLINYNPEMNMLIWLSASGYLVTKKSNEDTTSDTKSIVSNNVPNHEEVKKKRKVCFEGQQESSNVQINGDGIDKVRNLGVIPPAVVHGVVYDKACSYSENNSFSLWEGRQVNSEYVDLLTRIKEKHPETFEHFTPQTDILYTLGLNTFCSIVKAFSEDSSTSFTASSITRYRIMFTDLERWGFNTTWIVNHLSNPDRLLL